MQPEKLCDFLGGRETKSCGATFVVREKQPAFGAAEGAEEIHDDIVVKHTERAVVKMGFEERRIWCTY